MENSIGNINQVKYGRIFVDIDDKLRIVRATKGFYEISGFSYQDVQNGLSVKDLFKGDPAATDKYHKTIMRNLEKRSESFISHGIFNSEGTKVFVESYATLEYDELSGHNILNIMLSDVSEHRRIDAQIKMQNKRYQIIDETTDEIYFDYDVKNDIMHLPKKYFDEVSKKYNLARYWRDNSPRMNVHPDDYQNYKEMWDRCIKNQETPVIEFRTKTFTNDGSYEWYRLPLSCITDETGKVASVFGRMYPINHEKLLTEKISTDKQVIEKLSTTDPLTGLLNRNTFKQKSTEILENYNEKLCYAIIYSDINDFSYINDNFGYDEGNRVLCEFAKLIVGDSSDVLATRIYSDYFVSFVITDNQDNIINSCIRVNTLFTDSLKGKYPSSDIHVSTGVYFFNKNGTRDITIAMDNANLARRSVKGSKDVPCGIYSESLRKKRSHDQTIASELNSAIKHGYIETFLQPKFSLDTREIIGAEALARWKNQDGTYKLPFEFIDVLEKAGNIVELDYCIYETVLKTMKRWSNTDKKLFPVSVNFSRLHTLKDNFVESIIELADYYEIDKSLIEIEVTESAFAADSKTMSQNLAKLREAGFKIDIDDFGIGYSSLSMLMTAPIDTVKVDKFFIDNIVHSEIEREYVKQICILIATTKKNVVFEGVETEEQAQFISDWGFSIAQGWLFDKALSIEIFEKKYM